MTTTYRVTCKDCGETFTFGTNRRDRRLAQGLSTDERCPSCQERAAREGSAVGLRYFTIPGLRLGGVATGSRLGRLEHAEREHVRFTAERDPHDVLSEGCGLEPRDVQLLYDTAREHRVIVAIAPTGLGKSTLLPYTLVNPPRHPDFTAARDQFTRFGQVIVSQPRRVAAEGISTHVGRAHTGIDDGLGPAHDFGYAIGGDARWSEDNLVVQMTHGSLLNQVAAGKLASVSAVIIDEAHERNPEVDLLLGLLRREMVLYPDLRVLIVSATIDAQQFTSFFSGDATVLDWSDKTKPVAYELRLAEADCGRVSAEAIVKGSELDRVLALSISRTMDAVGHVFEIDPGHPLYGDVLVFAPTRKSVESVVAGLRARLAERGMPYPVLPLYRELAEAEQELAKALEPSPKVIVATTIAETSVTFPNLRHVVDNGLIMQPIWDFTSGALNFPVRYHSQAGCRQRWGRVGRNAPGIAWCTYARREFDSLPAYTVPTLMTGDLTTPLLQLVSHGFDIDALEHLEDFFIAAAIEKDQAYLRAAFSTVKGRAQAQGTLDGRGHLTDLGRATLAANEHRDNVALLHLADRHGLIVEAATLVAATKVGIRRHGGTWAFEHSLEGLDADSRVILSQRRQSLHRPEWDLLTTVLELFGAWDMIGREARERAASLLALDVDWFKKVEAAREALLIRPRVRAKEERGVIPALGGRLRSILPVAWPHRVWLHSEGERYANGNDDAILRQGGAAPPVIVSLDMPFARDGEKLQIHSAIAGPETIVDDAAQLLVSIAPIDVPEATPVLFASMQLPQGTTLEAVTDPDDNSNLRWRSTALTWAPSPTWGDQAAVPASVQQARQRALRDDDGNALQVDEPVDSNSRDVDADADADELWTTEESNHDTDSEARNASGGSLELDAEYRGDETIFAGTLAEVVRHEGGRAVLDLKRASSAQRLLDSGLQIGNEVAATVVERTDGAPDDVLAVIVHSDPDVRFHLDVSQLNFESAPAVIRLLKVGTRLPLRCIAIDHNPPRVILTRLPYLEDAYQSELAPNGRVRQASMLARHERRIAVQLARAGTELVLATAIDDASRGAFVQARKNPVTVTVQRRPASEFVRALPSQLRVHLTAAGISIEPGSPIKLTVERALRFNDLVPAFDTLSALELEPEEQREVGAAINALYRRSVCPIATVVEEVRTAKADAGGPPRDLASRGVEQGTVRNIYRGNAGAGAGAWIELPDGKKGYLVATQLPDGVARLRVDGYVPVERAGSISVNGRPTIALEWRGTQVPKAAPKSGDVFDDATFERTVPGLTLFRFGGRAFRGAVKTDEYERATQAQPDRRRFRVRVDRPKPDGNYRLTLIDPE